jgi:signal transduction histidine kinase
LSLFLGIVPKRRIANEMNRRTWPLLTLAFGLLIILLGLSGTAMYRHVAFISGEVARNQQSFEDSERELSALRSDVYSLAVLARDYLLDDSPEAIAEQRKQLLDVHASIEKGLLGLQRSTGPKRRAAVAKLRQGIDEYWKSIDAILLWTPAQKAARSPAFLRDKVVPYRATVLSLANQVGALNLSNLEERQSIIMTAMGDLQGYLARVLASAIALGLVIAGVSVGRMTVLENRAERHRAQVEQDRKELRGLSQQLVRAQEEERKSLSRELHDQVGQMLTALRMELGNLDQLRSSPGNDFAEHLGSAQTLSEQTLRSVRDMAMGLRPSLLDDLGLASALKWQAREFARRSGTPVDVQIEGSVDHLSENYRTCVYRVVQEALTNCARHAGAESIRITCHGTEQMVSVLVQDDGLGFDPKAVTGRGVGLLGVDERVRELGGTVSLFSQPNKGTILRVEIPINGALRT